MQNGIEVHATTQQRGAFHIWVLVGFPPIIRLSVSEKEPVFLFLSVYLYDKLENLTLPNRVRKDVLLCFLRFGSFCFHLCHGGNRDWVSAITGLVGSCLGSAMLTSKSWLRSPDLWHKIK